MKPWGKVCEAVSEGQVSEMFTSLIPFSGCPVTRVVSWYAYDDSLSRCLFVTELTHPLDVTEPILVKLWPSHMLWVTFVVCYQIDPYLRVWGVVVWQAHGVYGVLWV